MHKWNKKLFIIGSVLLEKITFRWYVQSIYIGKRVLKNSYCDYLSNTDHTWYKWRMSTQLEIFSCYSYKLVAYLIKYIILHLLDYTD